MQYKQKCKKHSIPHEKSSVDKVLSIPVPYFRFFHALGVNMLAHTSGLRHFKAFTAIVCANMASRRSIMRILCEPQFSRYPREVIHDVIILPQEVALRIEARIKKIDHEAMSLQGSWLLPDGVLEALDSRFIEQYRTQVPSSKAHYLQIKNVVCKHFVPSDTVEEITASLKVGKAI